MSHTVIVPNNLSDLINAKLDKALEDFPEATPEDREHLFTEILTHFYMTGSIPDFKVTKNEDGQ